jgi:hypothetical protein
MSYIAQKIASVLLTHRQVPEDAISANIRGMCVECRNGPWTAEHQAEEVVKALGMVQFYSVDYGDGEMAELSWEHYDEARDHAAEGLGDDLGDSKILTGWFTGWEPAENVASLT